jgi:hypothetical protein
MIVTIAVSYVMMDWEESTSHFFLSAHRFCVARMDKFISSTVVNG